MPKNCKGCIRYKLLAMYQYVQSYLQVVFSCLLAANARI